MESPRYDFIESLHPKFIEQLHAFFSHEKRYFFKQLEDWVFVKKATNFAEFTNISKKNREILAQNFFLPSLSLVSQVNSGKDQTVKFLLRTQSGHTIEAVLIDDGLANKGYILCLSSQKGCSLACRFCATGTMGMLGNLSSGEIVSQYLMLAALSNRPIKRIVFMGMGEPFLNRKNVFLALDILCGKDQSFRGFGISSRRIAISTSGILRGIEELAGHSLNIRLSLSLHSAIDESRAELMPDLKNISLLQIAKAMQYYSRQKNQAVFVEYIMLKDLNDSDAHLKALIEFLKPLFVKVNFIAYNKVQGKPYKPSSQQRIAFFIEQLQAQGIVATQRYKKGDDIGAACGQLVSKKIVTVSP